MQKKYRHKTTLKCPKCKYTSRQMHIPMNSSLTTWSTKCPIHRIELIDIGSSKEAVNKLKN